MVHLDDGLGEHLGEHHSRVAEELTKLQDEANDLACGLLPLTISGSSLKPEYMVCRCVCVCV